MFRTVRKVKNIEDTWHHSTWRITQRFLLALPQHMREPGVNTWGNSIPGPVEYISRFEIEHGNDVLGWLEGHISLSVVEYLVSFGANVLAKGGDYHRSIIHCAARESKLDVVQYLVSSHHVNVDATSSRCAWR
jgi:hypothetical protein